MSNYPEEIVKQAEELIEEHKEFADWDDPFANAVRAAIVSCKFANDYHIKLIGLTNKDINQIKAYLEGLL
jgi:hypothetical protein